MTDEIEKPKPDFSRIGKSNVSRSKSHERQVAKSLATWTGREFRRRRTTGRDHATIAVDMCADVIPVDSPFIFSVEAKTGKGFRFESMLTSPKTCLFTEWWHQTCYDAELVSKSLGKILYPMLFFRPNPQSMWVAVSGSSFKILQPSGLGASTGKCWFPHLYFDYTPIGNVSCNVSHGRPKPGKPKVVNMVELKLDSVVLCPWSEFAAGVDPVSALV